MTVPILKDKDGIYKLFLDLNTKTYFIPEEGKATNPVTTHKRTFPALEKIPLDLGPIEIIDRSLPESTMKASDMPDEELAKHLTPEDREKYLFSKGRMTPIPPNTQAIPKGAIAISEDILDGNFSRNMGGTPPSNWLPNQLKEHGKGEEQRMYEWLQANKEAFPIPSPPVHKDVIEEEFLQLIQGYIHTKTKSKKEIKLEKIFGFILGVRTYDSSEAQRLEFLLKGFL